MMTNEDIAINFQEGAAHAAKLARTNASPEDHTWVPALKDAADFARCRGIAIADQREAAYYSAKARRAMGMEA